MLGLIIMLKKCVVFLRLWLRWPLIPLGVGMLTHIWAASRIPGWYDGGTNDPDSGQISRFKQAELYVSRFDRAPFDARAFNVPKRGSYELLDLAAAGRYS